MVRTHLYLVCIMYWRMETLELRRRSGMAKLTGIIVCLGGVATLAFYKGPQLMLWSKQFHHHHDLNKYPVHHVSSGKEWIKGCFLMLSSNVCWAFWLIMQVIKWILMQTRWWSQRVLGWDVTWLILLAYGQAKIIKEYPSKLLLTTIQCFLSALQSFLIAIPFARDLNEWKLGWNVQLVSVAYCVNYLQNNTFYFPHFHFQLIFSFKNIISFGIA